MNQPIKNTEITALTFLEMERKIYMKIWRLRTSLTIKFFGKQ